MAGTTLGTAYVQIVPSAQGIKGSITNTLSGEAESAGTAVGSKISGFAKKALLAGGVMAGAAFIGAVKGAVAEGAKLQQSYLGGLDTLYGDAADSARAYAREAAAAGISMNDYAEQAVSFGAALKSAYGGDTLAAADAANTAILDMADNAAKMGTPLESIQNAYQGFAKQNYTMLDNLKLGYGGTKEEMERLLKDAQKISGVEYNIDNLGDVYSAIHVIQGELGLTGVAADEAAETFSGSLNAMKAAGANFLGSLALGEDVTPALMSLLESVRTFVVKNLVPMVIQVTKSLIPALGTAIREGVPVMLAYLVGALKDIAFNLTSLADGLTAEKVTTWITETAQKLFTGGGQLLKQLADGLIENIPKILAAVGQIGLTIIQGLGAAIWPKIKEAAYNIKESFLAPIRELRDKVREIIDKIKSFFSFNVQIPHIPLPHFGINPAGWKIGDLLKGQIPSLSIQWYAKGGIVDGAHLIGAGEAGPEAIVPLKPFWDRLETALAGSGNISINVYATPGMDVNDLAQEVERRLISATKRRNYAWR